MLEHGGRLREAAARWSIPLESWLDLSTGIAPWPYPVTIAIEAWQRLPEDCDGLESAAASYYGHPAPLPLPGSQAAIRWLPRLIPAGQVVLPAPSYGEYAPAWRAAGHDVNELPFARLAEQTTGWTAGNATAPRIVMLGQPNNPTGECLSRSALLALAQALEARDGWLIVDEAFADSEPTASLAPLAGTELPRLVVLRSLGKFFGLAGARVGFLCAADALRQRLAEALGPWAVAHPSRLAATQALADGGWQSAQRERLAIASERLMRLLADRGLPGTTGGKLFCHVPTPYADALGEHLARRGILVRRFAAPSVLRFGLPGDEPGWMRLAAALAEWRPA